MVDTGDARKRSACCAVRKITHCRRDPCRFVAHKLLDVAIEPKWRVGQIRMTAVRFAGRRRVTDQRQLSRSPPPPTPHKTNHQR